MTYPDPYDQPVVAQSSRTTLKAEHGKYVVEIYPSSVLGKERERLELTRQEQFVDLASVVV